MTQPTSAEADAVAALGDKVVPYIKEQLGKAYQGPGGKGDYWLIIILARIGTPAAEEVLVEILKHDYPGKVGHDREYAAKALVCLGVGTAAGALRAAIADTERQIREQTGRDPDELLQRGSFSELKAMRESLRQLQKGEGKRATKGFPFD